MVVEAEDRCRLGTACDACGCAVATLARAASEPLSALELPDRVAHHVECARPKCRDFVLDLRARYGFSADGTTLVPAMSCVDLADQHDRHGVCRNALTHELTQFDLGYRRPRHSDFPSVRVY